MNINIKQVAAAVVIALGSMGAQATVETVELGNLGPTAITGVRTVTGSFTDYLNFNVESPYNYVGGNVSNLSIFGILNITGLTVSLFDGINGAGSKLGSVSGQSAYQYSGILASGDYSLAVSGTATGYQGGMFSYAAIAQAVPEPESYAMFLAGLGLMGVIARRRRAN